MSPSRRGFLKGRLRCRAHPIRPPWSKPWAEFAACCNRCDDCLRACPGGIIRRGDAGFPEIDFGLGDKQCTFCRHCVEACKQAVFFDPKEGPAWRLRVTISDECLAKKGVMCRSCADICGPCAIEMLPLSAAGVDPRVSDSLCNGCGACFSLCPVDAIKIYPRDRA